MKYPMVQSEFERVRLKYWGIPDFSLPQFMSIQESRDPYTTYHQRRVAELARAIAIDLGLSEWNQKGIHTIGLLHDVGKISIPVEILE